MSETELRGGFPFDPIFKIKLRLSCPFCKNCGKPKIHHSTWALHNHFKRVHRNDAYCQKVIADLENLLKQGVIRP